MKSISLLIKPASGSCQLRCNYCFYKDVTTSREVPNYGMMTHETLELLVQKALSESEEQCSFAFQGGEPTLAGIDFYRKLISLQKKYNLRNIPIFNSLQTNGIVLDDEWCDFFTQNDFLIGLSLDGSKDIHDLNRVDAEGKGTFARVIRAAELMDKHKTEYNILCVVTNELARRAEHVYKFFREKGFRFIQFIPCIDDFDTKNGSKGFSLTPERYAHFLKTFFDLWYTDLVNGRYMSVRHFDNWVQMLRGRPPESCSMSGRCVAYGVVEADGSVFPCDFYVLDKWKLGNIFENSLTEMLTGPVAAEFVYASYDMPDDCKRCEYLSLCRNGCRRDRERLDGGAGSTVNRYCSAYKEFFEYSTSRLVDVANRLTN
ncbi:MAG: anaerobic sulfatase maturase [Saccharofermentanales bacterium]